MTRLTLTLPDLPDGTTVADVLDAIALADDIHPSGGRGRSTVAKLLIAHACATALRERDEVRFLVGLRHEYAGARPVARVTPLKVVS